MRRHASLAVLAALSFACVQPSQQSGNANATAKKTGPILDNGLDDHLTGRLVFWKVRPKKTTGSRRKPADGHRNPSQRTRASAMACWQFLE